MVHDDHPQLATSTATSPRSNASLELGLDEQQLGHRRRQHAAATAHRRTDIRGDAPDDAMDCSASIPLTPSSLSDREFGGNGSIDVSERSVLVAPLDGDGESKPRKHATWEWMLGVFFLVIVALIWTFASVLVQYIFHNLSFNGPFFLTYVGITLFSVNLPLWYVSQIAWPRTKAWFQGRPTSGKLSHHELLKRTGHKASYRQIFWISATISPLWFLANFTYNQSLNMTSVTSSTIVSSTSTVFTFLMSVLVLREPFKWLKVFGVVLCMAGNISTIFNDSNAEDGGAGDHVVGDLVALFAAFMYGVYTTAIRRLVPSEESVSISLFFGFIGVINFVCLLPFVLLFHYSGVESLSGLTFEILGLIGIKGLFDNVLSDYLWARAVLLTSPTVATVGLSLTVPLAILADYVFHQSAPTSVTLLASVLVLSGFVLINVSTKNNQHEYHPVATTTTTASKELDDDTGSSSTSGLSPPQQQYPVAGSSVV